MHSCRRALRGFTLTELLIVLTIAGILVTLGAPSFVGLLARTSEATAEASIAESLRHARSRAVLRNARVLVCPSSDGRRCSRGDEWQQGWLIAADADHDGQPDAGAPAPTAMAALPHGTRIITSVGRGQLAFQPTGTAGGSNATFTVCHARTRDGKSVVLANSGRVRIGKPDAAHLQACLAGLR